MAKRGQKQSNLASYAEGVGTFLGQIRSRWDHLSQERGALTKQLQGVINNAQSMLSEITEGVQRGVKRGRPVGSANVAVAKRGKRKRRKMSAAARAKIAAAQRRRWAKHKARNKS